MSKDTPPPIFREQALQQRRRSVYGQVILKGSLSSWIITALLAAILILGGLFLCLAQVQTDNGPHHAMALAVGFEVMRSLYKRRVQSYAQAGKI